MTLDDGAVQLGLFFFVGAAMAKDEAHKRRQQGIGRMAKDATLEVGTAIARSGERYRWSGRGWTSLRTTHAPKSVIGAGVDLPDDLAKNHDYYLHGTPKQ